MQVGGLGVGFSTIFFRSPDPWGDDDDFIGPWQKACAAPGEPCSGIPSWQLSPPS